MLTMDFYDTVFQQCAEESSTSSSRATRASSKGPSPPTLSSTPIKEPPVYSTSMASSKTGMAMGMVTGYENDDEDPLASSGVTISKHGKTRIQKSSAASLRRESPSIRERRAPVVRETWRKKKGTPPWSQQESDTLRNLCYAKDKSPYHLTLTSPFWKEVLPRLPGRTKSACFMKWKQIRGKKREKKATDSPGIPASSGVSGSWWSDEELKKLAQCCSQQPRTADDWAKIAAQIPGRTSNACEQQYRKRIRGVNPEIVDETRPEEVLPIPAADEESVQGNLTTREGEGDDWESPD